MPWFPAWRARKQFSSSAWRTRGVSAFTIHLLGWKKERRFFLIRERVRESEGAVRRKLLDVPGYTFRFFVTNRSGTPSCFGATIISDCSSSRTYCKDSSASQASGDLTIFGKLLRVLALFEGNLLGT